MVSKKPCCHKSKKEGMAVAKKGISPSNDSIASKIEAVILDFDGVITDSEKHWTTLIRTLVETHGLQWTDDLRAQTQGRSQSDTWKLLCEKYGLRISREHYDREMNTAIENMYVTKAALVKGVASFIVWARKHKFKLAIATSSTLRWVELFLKRFDLDGSFDTIVTAEDGLRGKPEPDVYLATLSRLNVKADAAIAIEDSTNGVLAAVTAGILTMGFLNGLNTRTAVEKATIIVSSFAEASDKIGGKYEHTQ
jgi:HAD superfamily hydrolase (TIGR01509 family)